MVVPFEDFVWICDCENRQIIRFDVTKERFKTFDIPEEAYLVGPKQKGSPDELWLVDQGASAVTPLDPRTAERGRAIGFDGPLADAEIGLGKIWIAAAKHVYVLDQNDDQAEPVDIAMPVGSSHRASPSTASGTLCGSRRAGAPSTEVERQQAPRSGLHRC